MNKSFSGKKIWICGSLIIWLCYFIVFLGVYPGFFVYDAAEELSEVATRSFNTQHPLLHVLSLGGTIQAVHKLTGDYNSAIAVFILIQMTAFALILGYFIYFLRKNEITGKVSSVILMLYFGLFPVLSMYALCSSKDVMFAGFLVLVFVCVKKYIAAPELYSKMRHNKEAWFFVLFSVLMMLFRNNGVYAYMLFGAIACFILYRLEKREYTAAKLFIMAVLLYGVITRGMELITDAQDVGHREILTVPIQQLARIYAYDNEALSENEKAGIELFIPKEALLRYDPACSDLVKIAFDEKAYEENKADFYKLWIKLGYKHPTAYLKAWAGTSRGLLVPGALIDGYKGRTVYTFTYGESSYFGYETEPPGERKPLIPYIDEIFRYISLDVRFQYLPVIRYIFSPGFVLWVYIFCFALLIYKKRTAAALPYILPLCVVFTCLFGPMSLVRYVFYLWIFVPAIICECAKRPINLIK